MLHNEFFSTMSLTNYEPLQNQHPWENLNIRDINSQMVSVFADGGNSEEANLFYVNLCKTPIYSGKKIEYFG